MLNHPEQPGLDEARQPPIVMLLAMLTGQTRLRWRHGAGNPKSCQPGMRTVRRTLTMVRATVHHCYLKVFHNHTNCLLKSRRSNPWLSSLEEEEHPLELCGRRYDARKLKWASVTFPGRHGLFCQETIAGGRVDGHAEQVRENYSGHAVSKCAGGDRMAMLGFRFREESRGAR